MSDEFKIIYTVQISKAGRAEGLDSFEEVIVGISDPGMRVDPSGALVFVYNESEVIVYAPGTWVTVVAGQPE